jgi:hypothetical protein
MHPESFLVLPSRQSFGFSLSLVVVVGQGTVCGERYFRLFHQGFRKG